VAVYPSALSSTDVLNHFNNTNNNYTTFVQANSPLIYLRLNEPDGYNLQTATGTFPVATNYGNIGVNANGLYQPGIIPGIAGPTNGGFGSSYGVAINGMAGVDIGAGNLTNLAPQLNRTGLAPVSLVAWFKGPADPAGR